MTEAQRNTYTTAKRVVLTVVALAAVVHLLERFTHGVVARPFHVYIVGFDPMRASGMLAVALLYAILPARAWERRVVLVAGVALEAMMFESRPSSWSFTDALRCTGIGLGAACLAGIAFRCLSSRGDERQAALGTLCLALILPSFPFVSDYGHREVIRATPLVYDEFAYALDGLPGFQPAFAIAGVVKTHAWLSVLAMMAYEQLPLMLMCAVVLTMLHPRRRYNNVLLGFSLMAAVGSALYVVYPLIGIQGYVGADFPLGTPPPPEISPMLIPWDRAWPRNSMPSLHMAWILAIFWSCCRVHPGVRLFGLVAVALTVGATLYVGHYAIDLVAAFPFALAFQALTARRTGANREQRLLALSAGVLMTGATLAALRLGSRTLIAHPWLTLLGEGLLVLTSVALESRLAGATLAERVAVAEVSVSVPEARPAARTA